MSVYLYTIPNIICMSNQYKAQCFYVMNVLFTFALFNCFITFSMITITFRETFVFSSIQIQHLIPDELAA